MAANVASLTPAIAAMQADWQLARALLGGTEAMRKAGPVYLPRWPREKLDAYEVRRATAVLFPAYGRTVSTLAAKPFSKPVTRGDNIPANIADWLEDVDLEGRNLDAFAADSMETALGYGLGGILVEFPRATGVLATAAGARTVAAEKAAGLRPYWVQIHPWQLRGCRAKRVGGAWQIQQLRFSETIEEPDGDFGTAEVEQIRVIEPGRWRTFRKDPARPDEWLPHQEGPSLDVVPFVPVYGRRCGFMSARPPLIEVAHMNVAHWQSASDQQHLLHIARAPILTAIGVEDSVGANGELIPWEFEIGAAAIRLPMGSDLKYVEHTGAALGAGEKDLETLEERMRQAGAELLVIAPGKITATQIHTENAVGMCALQRITLELEDALDLALGFTARWVRAQQGGNVTLFNDYGAASLQEASAELLLKATQAGKISDETFHVELQRRGILSADVDFATEQARIDSQGPALGAIPPTPPPPGAPVAPPARVAA